MWEVVFIVVKFVAIYGFIGVEMKQLKIEDNKVYEKTGWLIYSWKHHGDFCSWDEAISYVKNTLYPNVRSWIINSNGHVIAVE